MHRRPRRVGAILLVLVVLLTSVVQLPVRSATGSLAPRGGMAVLAGADLTSTFSGVALAYPDPVPRATPVHPETTYAIEGNVTTHTDPPLPLVGVGVEVNSRPCAGPVSPSTCPFVAATTTSASGAYIVDVGPGDYFVHANNSSRWGGDWKAVTVTSSDLIVDLVEFPWVPYGNATFVLPHWNNLSSYAANCNAAGPCSSGIYGTQTPVLSWTEDGAYYVNASGRLVFYSFATGEVRDIAYWRYLYDDLMVYQGIENTEWITPDGAYVYEFGCSLDCASASYPVLYAVNTSTGQTFNHTFTSVDVASLSSNTQINLIGENGNASIAVLFGDGNRVIAYNLWNGTEWTIGSVPYFEANNIYWVSSLNAFFDVEAGGHSGDQVDELRLEGPAPGTELVSVYSLTYAYGFTVNGVNGAYVNVTDHTLVVSELQGGAPLRTERFDLGRNGTLNRTFFPFSDSGFGAWPDDSAPPNAWSSEHRPMITSDGPMVNGIWNGLFDNNSWLFEPATDQFVETNLSFDHMRYGSSYRQNSQSPAAVEGLFVNASYGVISESVNCRTNLTSCPIRGTATGTTPGTVWWTWRLGLPELPFSASTVGPELQPPGPVAVSASATATTVGLSWSVPATGAHPLLNYTLFWGPSGGPLDHIADLWASNTSARIANLTPSTPYEFRLEAWNLHWHNAGTFVNVSTTAPRPPLTITAFAASPSAVDAGDLATVHTTIGGGEAPFTFAYGGLPSDCRSVDSPTLNCTSRIPGFYPVEVTVTDVAGASATATASLLIGPPLAVTVRLSSPVVDGSGTSAATVVFGTPGTPPYSYAWDLPTGPASGSSVTVAAPGPGSYPVTVNVTDALGGHAVASAAFVVHPPLLLGATLAPSSAVDIGRPLWVNATATGGTSPLSTFFPALPAGCGPASGGRALCTPSTLGDTVIVAEAVDDLGATATWNGTITVEPDPMLHVTVTPTPIFVGGPLTVATMIVGGVPSFSYDFSGLPAGCAVPISPVGRNTTLTCHPSAAGSTRVEVAVIDADGAGAFANVTVTVVASSTAGAPGLWEIVAAVGIGGLLVAVMVALDRRRSRSRRSFGPRAGPPAR